jgi:hypothetical protein
MTLSVSGVPASCEKFPHSSQFNFWSTESIFNRFDLLNRFQSVLKTLNAVCVCLQYKHPRSMKKVIRSDKPVTLLLLFWSHKCGIGAEPRSRIIATSAVKGLIRRKHLFFLLCPVFAVLHGQPGHSVHWCTIYCTVSVSWLSVVANHRFGFSHQ